jgi:hypothetical protein
MRMRNEAMLARAFHEGWSWLSFNHFLLFRMHSMVKEVWRFSGEKHAVGVVD